ncbi:MAG: 50S ribosomal protein L13 [Saprospiraceae bacterium]
MNTLSYKTKSQKKEEMVRKWYVIDAEGEVVGRLATKVAHILRGKHRPDYTPHFDAGDYVIIVNAEKVRFTGNKYTDKIYSTYSGYPGGLKKRSVREMFEKKPFGVIENAVRGMLPKNKLGRQMFKKLFVYVGSDHPHQAQKPEKI